MNGQNMADLAHPFDYIIVGSGAGGAVTANRLSADERCRVLVLEAGGADNIPSIANLSGFVSLWNSDLDWQLQTEPQPGMAGRQLIVNQGKVLGGSTSLSAMMYVRGNRLNYDQWAAMGADGWSFQEVLPTFRDLETCTIGSDEFHGRHGPIPVVECPDRLMVSPEFMAAATQLGYDGPNWDSNGARQENGAGLLQFHIHAHGQRASAANIFLHPLSDRQNLVVETGAQVTRILLERGRAWGVEYLRDGHLHSVRASSEVILSAGALQSPKVLMLSGIGPADRLRKLGIAVVSDLAGVGQNLQDHVQLPVVFKRKTPAPSPTLLTGNVLFLRTRERSQLAPPDMQLNFTPAVPGPLSHVLEFPFPACIFLPILVQPFSRGEVQLRSADPTHKPVIHPNYLSQKADVDAFLRVVEIIRDLAATPAFSDLNAMEILPGPEADLEAYIRGASNTVWHPAGTARMGHDALAVVDPQLRVYGVDGLRVVDASVMPTVTSGNTVAPTYMIGEKAADMILHGS